MWNRRDCRGSVSVALAGLSLKPSRRVGAQFMPLPARKHALSLNRNWRFSAKRFDGDTKREFNDTAFESVTIPHTNLRLPWHGFDEKSYEFTSIYRRHFR